MKIIVPILIFIFTQISFANENQQSFTIRNSNIEVSGNLIFTFEESDTNLVKINELTQSEFQAKIINSSESFSSLEFTVEFYIEQNGQETFLTSRIYEIFGSSTQIELGTFKINDFEIDHNSLEKPFKVKLKETRFTFEETIISKGKVEPKQDRSTRFVSLNLELLERPLAQKLEDSEFKKAIQHYTRVTRKEPENSAAFYKRGVNFLNQGYLKNAFSDFSKAISLNQKDGQSLLSRAVYYEEIGEFEKALEDLNFAIKLDGNFEEAYANRGYVYFQQRDFTNATKDFGNALAVRKSFEGYANRGYCYFALKDYKNAIEDFTQALNFAPENVETLYNRGTLYGLTGKFDLAILDLTKAIEIESSNSLAFLNRGSFYLELRKYSEAEKDFREAAKLGDSNSAIEYNLALSLIGQKKITEAKRLLKNYLSKAPNDRKAKKIFSSISN
ncbi:MAG: tetratricopeptide repeat protein [Calditrichaeota bacterium]|nr:MAG: tetratricopeptide repeat protein [Calditrichota bacterium]